MEDTIGGKETEEVMRAEMSFGFTVGAQSEFRSKSDALVFPSSK